MKTKHERRTVKLIKPGFQLKLIGIFVGLAALGSLMQVLHVAMRLTERASAMPDGGQQMMSLMPDLPIEILVFSFGMILPVTVGIGILVTHRIAGPTYRLEQYLKSVKRGEQLGPCVLRKRDELQELCKLINEVTEPLRHPKTQDEAISPPGVPAVMRKAS